MISRSPDTLVGDDPRSVRGVAPMAQTGIGWTAWMLPVFAVACWLLAIRHLSAEWASNEQYHFGWLVPVLTAYLIKVRFEHTPIPQPPQIRWVTSLAVTMLAMLSVLVMPVREANLDWRLIEWLLVPIAIGASLLCFWQFGGRPWVVHFAFPLLFFLIAVPIPRNFEYPWMDRLMIQNTHASVELLHWMGVEAVARGNLIQLQTGTLGVDEACSGIRSLQSTLMLSLFLGELFALPWLRRLLLLGAGWCGALLANVVRTTFLATQAARDGIAAVDRWHDIAGFAVLGLCAAAVGATAWLLARTRRSPSPAPAAPASLRLSDFAVRFRPVAFAGGAAVALLVAGGFGMKAWFNFRSRSLTVVPDWEFQLPSSYKAFREEPIAPRTRKILNYDEGITGKWIGPSNDQWQAFYFRWVPGRNATQSSRVHDPRICLGRAGMELIAELPPVRFERDEVGLVFDAYHFRDGAQDLFVFNCLAEDVRAAGGLRRTLETNSPAERIAAALAGRRQAGQRRVEVAVWNSTDSASAAQEFTRLLEAQIRLTPKTAQH